MSTPTSTQLFQHTVQDELVSGFLSPETDSSSEPKEIDWCLVASSNLHTALEDEETEV